MSNLKTYNERQRQAMQLKPRWLLIAGLMFIMLLLRLKPVAVLQIYEEERQPSSITRLAQYPIEKGETFTIIWTHSVTRQPVTEVYRLNDDLTIGIEEMLFNEHGPNLPSGPEGSTLWEIKNGMFRVYNYDMVFEALPVRIGQMVADHTLVIRHKTIPLQELSRPGGFITIHPRQTNALQYLFEEGRLWLITKISKEPA
ncbi:DUF1850 domain-containing protein [Anoxynatronum sibiricum]|uniref:DUF1850 domain-containing protein n=1 Tax=Anoxynatronum sibiricum TaxID=210623 RepID=A0ABU9VVK7_9CLOT